MIAEKIVALDMDFFTRIKVQAMILLVRNRNQLQIGELPLL